MAYSKTWNEIGSTSYLLASRSSGSPYPTSPYQYNSTWPVNLMWSFPHSKSGQKVPKWREKITKGLNASSPYSRSGTSLVSIAGGSASLTWSNPGVSIAKEEFSGTYRVPAIPTLNTIPVTVSNKALTRITDKLRHELEHFNLLPALGELTQTIRMFGAPFSSVVRLFNGHYDKLERRARGIRGSPKAKRTAWDKVIADTYLETVFGLLPLIEDTKSIAESLARWNAELEEDLPRPTSLLLKATAFEKTATVTTGAAASIAPLSNILCSDRYVNKQEHGVKYTVKLKYSLQAQFGSNNRLLQLLGLNRLANFIPTAWEITPWSWLFDYFVNIQEILEAGVTDKSNIDWIVKGERQTATTSYHGVLSKQSAGGWAPTTWVGTGSGANHHAGKWETSRRAFTRSLPASLGVPMINVVVPTSSRKYANMLAVLIARRAKSEQLFEPFRRLTPVIIKP